MTCLYLIRHGEVEGNQATAPTFVGWEDKSLTARGLAQAQAVARRLEEEFFEAQTPNGPALAAVYTSDLQRAATTARTIAEATGAALHVDADWRELNYGEWEGRSEAEIARGWPELWPQRVADPWGVAVPGGESLTGAWQRWQRALEKMLAQHSGEEAIALVAHNGTLRCLLCHFLGAPLVHYRRIVLANCGLSCIEVHRGAPANGDGAFAGTALQFKIRSLNETQHLKGI